MTTDNADFKVGGVQQPLGTSTGKALLQDGDPALFYALDFWQWLIETYPGPRLIAEVNAAGMTTGSRSDPIRSAVAQAYPYQPQSEFRENQFAFPLLACYRTRTSSYRHTAGWESDRGGFELIYAIQPMTSGQLEVIYPLLHLVQQVLRKKTTQGFDPGYTPPGGTLGQSPWTLAGVESVGFGHEYTEAPIAEYGFLQGTGELAFPCLKLFGYFVERDSYVPAQNQFAGGDMEIDLLAPDGSVAQHFMDLSTQQAPTVTSLSVTTGPIAGGTSVTITGTLLLPAPVVRFGTTLATGVTWNSATSITCVTPALSGPGTVSVTVTNRDGQAGSLQNAFTYS